MSPENAWAHIQGIGWNTDSFNLQEASIKLLLTLGEDQRAKLEAFVHQKWHELYKELQKQDGLELGDDSLSDLIYHVIGLGQQQYEAVLNRPMLAQAISFHEGFNYIFQLTPEDLKLATYAQRLSDFVDELNQSQTTKYCLRERTMEFAFTLAKHMVAGTPPTEAEIKQAYALVSQDTFGHGHLLPNIALDLQRYIRHCPPDPESTQPLFSKLNALVTPFAQRQAHVERLQALVWLALANRNESAFKTLVGQSFQQVFLEGFSGFNHLPTAELQRRLQLADAS